MGSTNKLVDEKPIDEKLVDELHETAKTGKPLELPLLTDDRVLARITDGIYRQPASALRELIANAYDADASEVTIVTDAPRFSKILVRDNGIGMSARALLNMVQHIGGSAKRTHLGQNLGITDSNNPSISRQKKRKLIGKMGIGLFSVAQLTRQFTIITKPKSENYRYTAVVTLHHYSDDPKEAASEGTFRAGETLITCEAVTKNHRHGTTIELGTLIPRARRILQSHEAWEVLRNPSEYTNAAKRIRPAIHCGLIDSSGGLYLEEPNVPWKGKKVTHAKRLDMLSTALIEAAEKNDLYAQIEHAFDYYFRMIWSLGLALPLEYIDKHPFAVLADPGTNTFLLSNKTRPASDIQATEILAGEKTFIENAPTSAAMAQGNDFRVDIDNIRLYRPIRFDKNPPTSRALQTPLLFVGAYHPDLAKFDKNQTGGQELEFAAYFFWTPKVVPKEHNGLLVRINGASGTLFDSTFLNYQVAERNRLKQLIAEVFVTNGLEGALNIDRESFNTTHPHYQILLSWVHNALRQVFNKQKQLETAVRKTKRAQTANQNRGAIQQTRDEELQAVLGEDADTVSGVIFTDNPEDAIRAQKGGMRAYSANIVSGPVSEKGRATLEALSLNEARAIALVQLLDAYGALEALSSEKQGQLIKGILRIFNAGA